jgi:hypothetical protein
MHMHTKYEGYISREIEVMSIFRNLNAKCDRNTDRQTDSLITICPLFFERGHKNCFRLAHFCCSYDICEKTVILNINNLKMINRCKAKQLNNLEFCCRFL